MIQQNEDMRREKTKLFSLYVIAVACLGGILYGYDIGIINGDLDLMRRALSLTDNQMSFIVAAVLGGGCLATLVSGPLSDAFGRVTMIRVAALTFIAGILVILSAKNYAVALAGRLIQGIGVGIITIIIPLYLAETTASKIRGRVISLFQLLLTAGILGAYLVGQALSSHENWHDMFMTVLLPASLLLLGSLFLPESPRWLYNSHRKAKAVIIIQKLFMPHEAAENIRALEQTLQRNRDGEFSSVWESIRHFFSHLRQRKSFMPFAIAFAIACLGQTTGINSILQFSTLMLEQSGLPSHGVSMFGTIGLGLINFALTFVALLLIDKVGRKPLLSIGAGGVCLALLYCGFVSHMPNDMLKGELLIAGLLVYVGFFAVGPGVVVWMAISELMPLPIRGIGMAVCLFFNSAVSTIVSASVMPIAKWGGGYYAVFWLCAGFTVLYFLVACFLLPETKNKTLEDIELSFDKNARLS